MAARVTGEKREILRLRFAAAKTPSRMTGLESALPHFGSLSGGITIPAQLTGRRFRPSLAQDDSALTARFRFARQLPGWAGRIGDMRIETFSSRVCLLLRFSARLLRHDTEPDRWNSPAPRAGNRSDCNAAPRIDCNRSCFSTAAGFLFSRQHPAIERADPRSAAARSSLHSPHLRFVILRSRGAYTHRDRS